MSWKKIERLRKEVSHGCVEVCHWYTDDPVIPNTSFRGQRKHKWNIYAILYPKHPLFKEFDLTSSYSDIIPMHGGCTYFKVHRDNAGLGIQSIEIGCDYCHLYDERFEEIETFEQADEILADAEELIQFLNNSLEVIPSGP